MTSIRHPVFPVFPGGGAHPPVSRGETMIKTRTRMRAVAVAGLAVALTGVLGVFAPAAASASHKSEKNSSVPFIPDAVKPPAGSKFLGAYLVVSGTQNYTCVVPAGATTGAFTGGSVPEAKLLGTGGWIHHFAGPSWQSKKDGSLVTAARSAGSDREGTIPELLLKINSHSGKGILTKADWINRVLTSGGVAPAGTCKAGKTVKVSYGAIYVFWDDPAI
jgi:hypothetical protein